MPLAGLRSVFDDPDGDPDELSDHDPATSELSDGSEDLLCWRCRKLVPADLPVCPVCRAPQQARAALASVVTPQPENRSGFLVAAITSFVVMLAAGLINAFVQSTLVTPTAMLLADSVVTASFAMVVVVTWLRVPSNPTSPDRHRPLLAWLVALPMLAGLLSVNVVYHYVLREYLGQQLLDNPFKDPVQIAWLLALTCVFPPILEELYFRRVVLDGMYELVDNRVTAVWISSLMFGMAHIGQPFGIPYLVLVGVVLAMLKIWTGGLILPMLVHAAHNAVVVALAVLPRE